MATAGSQVHGRVLYLHFRRRTGHQWLLLLVQPVRIQWLVCSTFHPIIGVGCQTLAIVTPQLSSLCSFGLDLVSDPRF